MKPNNQTRRAQMSEAGSKGALYNIKMDIKKQARAKKHEAKMQKLDQKIESKTRTAELRQKKAEARRVGNRFEQWKQGKIDLKNKKREAQMHEYDVRARSKDLDPKLKEIEATTNAEVKKAKAQAASKMAGYTAVGTGMSSLGRGLIDEQNRDDAKNQQALKDNLEKIFGGNDGSNSGDNGVTTGDGLSTGEE